MLNHKESYEKIGFLTLKAALNYPDCHSKSWGCHFNNLTSFWYFLVNIVLTFCIFWLRPETTFGIKRLGSHRRALNVMMTKWSSANFFDTELAPITSFHVQMLSKVWQQMIQLWKGGRIGSLICYKWNLLQHDKKKNHKHQQWLVFN